ncbi:MAG: penicillin-binding transpeptidase domain-containing protein, partial [Brachymonas sp.]|nr:penicillin-binding transpeptidase domain-containing protein [Brachymonas sp.]
RGVLPSPEWKRKTYKRPEQQKWLSGETISLGIGQGYNNFTMLQLAHALATLVNGGNSFAPRLGLYLQDPLTQTQQALERPLPVNLGYKKQHIDLIKSAMVGVTQEGTSRGVFMGAGYTCGGKTGTAQAVTIGQKQRYNAAALAEHKRDHSLYVAFAPADKPVIAIAVIVENAGFGAAAAAPIARRVLDYWLLGQYPSPEDIAATRVGRSSAPIGQRRQVAQMSWPPSGMVASPLAANVPATVPLRGAVGAILPAAVGASGAASAPAVGNVGAVPAVAAPGATLAPSAAGPVAAAPTASALASSAALAPPYAPAPAAQALTTLFERNRLQADAAAAATTASAASGASQVAGSASAAVVPAVSASHASSAASRP